MCRWMAWYGQPVLIEELLYKTQHGLIDQSLHARMGVETTNGDGFGIGWYGTGEGPGLYRSVSPAWGDANLRDLAGHVETPVFIAHVRATTGTAVQETNCHPFRHGRWLFAHNGLIKQFPIVRRELMLAIEPARFPDVVGSTDSEVLFHLALSFGLERDPVAALEQAIGFVEATAATHGIPDAIQASIGVTDGERLWAIRYSTERRSRTLFASTDVHALHMLYPDNERVRRLHEDDRMIVSEPLVDLAGAWDELPESTAVMFGPGGRREQWAFTPSVPAGVGDDGTAAAQPLPA